MNRRQARALLTVLALSGGIAAIGTPALGESVRLTTGLGGFSVTTNAAPFKVLVDDPSNPLPRPEDAAIVEGDPAFTLAQVATGPASRGLASSLWPGNLLGEGIGAATNNAAPGYPVKADARYPDTPFTADDQTGGNLMHGSAQGLDASAVANRGAMSVPGTIDIGSMTSTSAVTVDKANVAIGHSVSKVSDVDLLGVIHIGSVSTVVESRSDGKKQTSSGTTVVSGLTVAGQGYTVDETGAHVSGAPGTGPAPLGSLDALKAAGITIGGVSQSATSDASGVTREAMGLRITVDTTMYRKALTDNTPDAVTAALYQAFAGLPLPPQAQTYKSFLYYTLSATPKITFILGAGKSFAVANLPIVFDFPSFPSFPSSVPPPSVGLFPPTSPVLAPVDGGLVIPDAPIVPNAPPVSAPGPTGQTTTITPAAGTDLPDPFSGVGALLILGALVAAALGGWGLLRLQGLALLGAAAGAGCALGAPSTVPNLRGALA